MSLPPAPPFPSMPPLEGVRLATARIGAPYRGRDDLLLVSFDEAAVAAALFTKTTLSAWPVRWSQRQIREGGGKAQILLVNAGIANALSGARGERAVREIGRACAARGSCAESAVLLASTGVIGEALEAKPIISALETIAQNAPSQSWESAARAIMTTDRFPKGAWAEASVKNRAFRICGIAKGAGMIAPNMATTLGFVFTDAPLSPALARKFLARAIEESFNAVSVDGDQSTNDCVMLFSVGKTEAEAEGEAWEDFEKALREVLRSLARQLVMDGEGTGKIIHIVASGAKSVASARRVARAIGESVIFKAAVAGGDANWGRVAAAIGQTGEPLSEEALSIRIGGVTLFEKGEPVANPPSKDLMRHMEGRQIEVEAHLGAGEATADFWGCDLTPTYLRINGARN